MDKEYQLDALDALGELIHSRVVNALTILVRLEQMLNEPGVNEVRVKKF